MTLKRLGTSDLRITPIGIGAWARGGGRWESGWGPQENRDSIAAIHKALDLGLNWIDTAPAYGLGHSEKVVGQAIKGLDTPPYVFTKCSLVWTRTAGSRHSLRAASIRREAEASLKRLRIGRMDHQIHWPAWKGHPEGASGNGSIEEAMSALVALQRQGKIRRLVVSNFSTSQMTRALDMDPITSLQPPYSLLNRQVEASILPFAAKNRIVVISYSPIYFRAFKRTRDRIAAFPADDWRRFDSNFREPRLLTANLQLAEHLREIGHGHNMSPGQVAIARTLHNPAVTGAIVA